MLAALLRSARSAATQHPNLKPWKICRGVDYYQKSFGYFDKEKHPPPQKTIDEPCPTKHSGGYMMMTYYQYSGQINVMTLNPLQLYWFHNPNTGGIIQEMGFSINHRGDLSTVLVPRVKLEKQLEQYLAAHNFFDCNRIRYNNHLDTRPKLILRNHIETSEPFVNLMVLLQGIAPFDDEMIDFVDKFYKRATGIITEKVNYETLLEMMQTEPVGILGKISYPLWPGAPEIPDNHYEIFVERNFSGNYNDHRYFPEIHRHPPNGTPELITALQEKDIPRIKAILERNPLSVFLNTTFRIGPIEFVVNCLQDHELFKLIMEHAVTLEIDWPAANIFTHSYKQFLSDKPSAKATLQRIFDSSATSPHKEYILQQLEKPADKRPDLHQACADGELDRVLALLQTATLDTLTEIDPWEFTALFIAVAEDHVPIAQAIINKLTALSAEERVLDHIPYPVIDAARSPEMIQLLLKYYHDPNTLDTLSHKAVLNKDKRTLEILWRYDREQRQDNSGLTPIDLAIVEACKTGDTDLLSFMLMHLNTPLAEYTPEDLPEPVFKVVAEHNAKRKKRLAAKASLPKHTATHFDKATGYFTTTFAHDALDVKSVIKPTATLTKAEQQAVAAIYHANFEKVHPIPAEKDALLPDSVFKDLFIELFYVDGKPNAFFLFNILIHLDDSQLFFLFFAHLAGSLPDQASLGLINLSFRMPIFFKLSHPGEHVEIFYKTVFPYTSYYLVPRACETYPRHWRNAQYMQTVLGLAGEHMAEPGLLKRTHYVKRGANAKSPAMQEVAELTHGDPSNALPVVLDTHEKNVTAFFQEKFHPHGLQRDNCEPAQTTFNLFVQHHGLDRLSPDNPTLKLPKSKL